MIKTAEIAVLATNENFVEEAYLDGNPDVRKAVLEGKMPSGRVHFERHGHRAPRYMRFIDRIEPLRRAKLTKIRPILKYAMCHEERAGKYDFLTAELRNETRIVATDNISSHNYGPDVVELIKEYKHGLILDCGAGRRNTYYENVLNYEIVDYDTTDVVGVGEALPFLDNSFDAVISNAVLEHVRDPFRCSSEIVRVLKPGGKLFCSVPFLQPEHGHPHHYYNMAPQGLRALFEDKLDIIDQRVTDFLGPIHALVWILAAWRQGLEGELRERFLDMKVRDFMVGAKALHHADFVQALSPEKNFELACATVIRAIKPST